MTARNYFFAAASTLLLAACGSNKQDATVVAAPDTTQQVKKIEVVAAKPAPVSDTSTYEIGLDKAPVVNAKAGEVTLVGTVFNGSDSVTKESIGKEVTLKLDFTDAAGNCLPSEGRNANVDLYQVYAGNPNSFSKDGAMVITKTDIITKKQTQYSIKPDHAAFGTPLFNMMASFNEKESVKTQANRGAMLSVKVK